MQTLDDPPHFKIWPYLISFSFLFLKIFPRCYIPIFDGLVYSLTSISLTLYVVFVSFVHVLNPLLNLSRSGGPRRLWGCSWTSRGPMQTLGSTLITRVTSYLCYFFQVLPRRWCEWKRYLNQVLIILIYIPSYMFYTWNILILTSTLLDGVGDQ